MKKKKIKIIYHHVINYYVCYHLSFQKFKLKTANTVISSENSSLQTMGTDKVIVKMYIKVPKYICLHPMFPSVIRFILIG